MTALAIIRFLQQLKDVTWGSPNDQDVLTYDAGTQKAVWATGGGGGGPPSGPAGGVLDGTYPDPGLAASVAGSGLAETADVLSVNVDNASIEISADSLQVKAGGVTIAMLAFDPATQAELNAAVALLTPLTTFNDHHARHENGGADEINVGGLSGELADAQPVTVRKNTGADVGTRSRLNLIEGSNVTLTVADDGVGDEIDITIAAAGGAPSGPAGGVLDGTYPNPGIAASVAGLGLSESGDVLSVNVDNATLEISTDTLQVKDGGITVAKLAFTVSTFAQTYLDDADAATTRATLGVIASLFQNGGAQELNVAGLNGELADAQPVTVRKNTGSDVGTRSRLNFIEGSNVTLTVADDAGGDEVDITIAASGGGGTGTGITSYESRSTNTILGTGDTGKVIDITAAITQTFTAAATLGSGWWVILRNATADGTTVVVLDPNSTETIDGVSTPMMYSGEARMIICDGSNFHSILLEGGFARFTADGTFQVPAGIVVARVECFGGGGGGGGGRGAAAGAVRNGGGGGGGGGKRSAEFAAAALGSAGDSISVDVAAGGSSGTGGSSNNGNPGGVGGNTTFGSLLTGYGGGGGAGGTNTNTQTGGGGGGWGEAGSVGISTTTIGAGARGGGQGGVLPGSGSAGAGGSNGAPSGSSFSWGQPSSGEGGGGGGGVTGGLVGSSGGSVAGGGGGGGGGGLTSGNSEAAGGAVSPVGVFDQGAGTGGGAANGGAGPSGADGNLLVCGQGGAGGGAQDSGTGGAGGTGGAPAGGGGGGGGGTSVGGAGGVGGRGECRVWYS